MQHVQKVKAKLFCYKIQTKHVNIQLQLTARPQKQIQWNRKNAIENRTEIKR